MGNFFGNIDSQSVDTMSMMGNGWLYAFFIIGVCLLLASWLVAWQVKRIQKLLARAKAEEDMEKEASNKPVWIKQHLKCRPRRVNFFDECYSGAHQNLQH